MTETEGSPDRRAQHVALLGGSMQLIAFGALWALSGWADGSHLLAVLSRFMLVGVPIWLVLYLMLNQIRRVRAESLETAELRRAQAEGTSQAIFDLDDESLLIEQRRLFWMVRWLLPAVTIIASVLLVVGHFLFWPLSLEQAFDETVLQKTAQPTMMMWFITGIGFLCFLYARYALAVARLPQWGLIRAGALCMVGSAMACVLVAVALMSTATIEWAEGATTYLIGIVLFVLGLEFAINFVLDRYRPRTPGEVPHPSFDSRLLGMIAEPGGFAKSIADAMNYQFGFQVSSTWFYQLLQRWLFPIVVVAFGVTLAMTCVVFVDADEQVVVEHFGQRGEGSRGILSPGLHFKWPYPVDVVYRSPVKRVREIVIGEAEEEEDEHGHAHGHAHGHDEGAVLWTEAHEFVPELMLLVASPKSSTEQERVQRTATVAAADGMGESVAVSLMMVSIPIEYRIKNIRQYQNRYEDPEKVMQSVAYQYLTDYAAGVDIDQLIGPGREAINNELQGRIQERLDALDLGIEVVFAGIRDAHPPAKSKVAAAFQSAISAQTRMAATINAARGRARKILTDAAGTEARAIALDDAIKARDRQERSTPEYAEAGHRVAELLNGNAETGIAPISGQAAATLAAARGAASERISREAAKAFTFGTQLAAFRAAPELYRQRKKLEVYSAMGDIRKYLIVGNPANVMIEYDVAREAGMDQVLSEGVETERARSKP